MVGHLAGKVEGIDELSNIDLAAFRKRLSNNRLSIAEVVILRSAEKLYAGDLLHEVVDVVVPAVFTVRNDVDTDMVLVHQRGLDGNLFDLGQPRRAQPSP